jgi:hypothetical protein
VRYVRDTTHELLFAGLCIFLEGNAAVATGASINTLVYYDHVICIIHTQYDTVVLLIVYTRYWATC